MGRGYTEPRVIGFASARVISVGCGVAWWKLVGCANLEQGIAHEDVVEFVVDVRALGMCGGRCALYVVGAGYGFVVAWAVVGVGVGVDWGGADGEGPAIEVGGRGGLRLIKRAEPARRSCAACGDRFRKNPVTTRVEKPGRQ